MQYRELSPHPALRRFVRCFWLLRVGEQGARHQGQAVVERVYPDGCAELIFHRVDRFEAATSERFEQQPRALLFGQLRQRVLLRRPPRVETIGVRFHHAGLAPLLGVPAVELTGRWDSFGAVAGAWAARLARRVEAADSADDAMRLIDVTLTRRAEACSPPDALVEAAIAELSAASGPATIGDVAGATGIGVRQLQRRFAEQVGLSPKRLAGILRLQQAFAVLDEGASPALIDVAYRCGYFDQSHFIRDFRRITGLPPGRFLREEGGMARLFVAG